jgi:ADP-ribose pyrophosphatase YjhB (NUDIX family)
VEAGETGHQAVVREVEEETGLTVHPTRLLGTVRRDAPDGRVYVIADYLCEVSGAPEPHAATDAADARWVDAGDYRRLPLIPGLTEALDSWDALPR